MISGERRLQGGGVNGALLLFRQRARRIPSGGGTRHPLRVQGIPHGHLDDWQPGTGVPSRLLYTYYFDINPILLYLDERGWENRPVPEADGEVGVLFTEPPLQTIQ